ncbi:neuropeptide-like 3 [Amyelois transitella]|uniref:neuropeptide-like 3 n=1 Tax=Amyelois transitella TaxID=680683 RepID=UPI00299019D9|nr:neuropeptide-like 3 [Amyelois transitella]
MFAKIFALFALVAVALAAPNPKPAPAPAPAPAPQFLTYSAGLDYVYPGAAVPSVVSPYSAPLAYSAFPGAVYYR